MIIFIILIVAMIIITLVDIVMNWFMMKRMDKLETTVYINDSFLNNLIREFSNHIKEEENGKEEKV